MSLSVFTSRYTAFIARLFVTCWFLAAIFVVLSPASSAASKLCLDDLRERHEVGPYLEILEDSSGQRTIEDVAAPAAGAAFSPVNALTVNRGVNNSVYWVRFSLVQSPDNLSAATRKIPWLLDIGWPFFTNVQAYMVSGSASGVRPKVVPIPFYRVFRPIGSPMSKERGLLARLPELPAGEQKIYLRLQTNSVFFLHPVVCTVKSYLEGTTLRMLWYGAYFGILLALLLYNLFLYFCLHDRSYLWYVASIAAIGAYFAGVDRLTFEFLLAWWPTDVLRINLTTLSASLIFLLWFARTFMQTWERAPQMDRLIKGLLFGLLGMLLLVPWARISFLNQCYVLLGILTPFVLVATALLCWRRGYRPARFLVLSWTLYGFCGLVYALTFLGWLPFNYVSFHSFQIGSALEAILLSFALADRINLLRQEREQLSHSERRHKELAVTDSLTGLYNRRYFDAQIDLNIESADRLRQNLTLMMLDVDNFKAFNDRYGHQEGDRALAILGKSISSCVRGKDVPCRYGGEEFTIILPGGQNSTAVEIYERINKELLTHSFGCGGGDSTYVTMSIGVAEHLPGEPADSLVRRADQALYEAKARGRNQIVIASREPEAVFFSCIDTPSTDTQPHL